MHLTINECRDRFVLSDIHMVDWRCSLRCLTRLHARDAHCTTATYGARNIFTVGIVVLSCNDSVCGDRTIRKVNVPMSLSYKRFRDCQTLIAYKLIVPRANVVLARLLSL